MSTKHLLVTVDDEHLSKIEDVARDLRARGMTVVDVLETTGVITGSCRNDPAVYRSLSGVQSVEEEAPMGIPEGETPG